MKYVTDFEIEYLNKDILDDFCQGCIFEFAK